MCASQSEQARGYSAEIELRFAVKNDVGRAELYVLEQAHVLVVFLNTSMLGCYARNHFILLRPVSDDDRVAGMPIRPQCPPEW